MAFELAFTEFMRHTITVEPYTGQDREAEPSYGSAVSYSCRIVGLADRQLEDLRTENVANCKIWVNTTSNLSVSDRLTLPASYAPDRTPQILAIEKYADDQGEHHLCIIC